MAPGDPARSQWLLWHERYRIETLELERPPSPILRRMRLGHWRAGHWIGRDHADEYEIDGDEHGGMVAQTGRWFSEAWWDGHWLKRTRCGQWRDTDGGVEVCHRRTRHDGQHAYSAPSVERARAAAVPDELLYGTGPRHRRRLDERGRAAGDFKAYLEARLDDAERDTRGAMVTPEGRKRGITGRHWFTGRRVSTRYATEELRDWLRDNGPTLQAREFHDQAAGAGGRRGLYAVARVPY